MMQIQLNTPSLADSNFNPKSNAFYIHNGSYLSNGSSGIQSPTSTHFPNNAIKVEMQGSYKESETTPSATDAD